MIPRLPGESELMRLRRRRGEGMLSEIEEAELERLEQLIRLADDRTAERLTEGRTRDPRRTNFHE